jgi:Ca2+-binding EF-hand superfamily protein
MSRAEAAAAFVAALTVLGAAGARAAPDRAPNLGRAFAQADLNGDGVVTRAEFEASRHGRFAALDRNRDGYLSLEDAPIPGGLAPRRGGRFLQALEPFDVNHDRRISFEEFLDGSMRLFDEADRNHDGQVDRAEAEAFGASVRSRLGR